jgi:hypothetical protein
MCYADSGTVLKLTGTLRVREYSGSAVLEINPETSIPIWSQGYTTSQNGKVVDLIGRTELRINQYSEDYWNGMKDEYHIGDYYKEILVFTIKQDETKASNQFREDAKRGVPITLNGTVSRNPKAGDFIRLESGLEISILWNISAHKNVKSGEKIQLTGIPKVWKNGVTPYSWTRIVNSFMDIGPWRNEKFQLKMDIKSDSK